MKPDDDFGMKDRFIGKDVCRRKEERYGQNSSIDTLL